MKSILAHVLSVVLAGLFEFTNPFANTGATAIALEDLREDPDARYG
jgi:hypothetical protein